MFGQTGAPQKEASQARENVGQLRYIFCGLWGLFMAYVPRNLKVHLVERDILWPVWLCMAVVQNLNFKMLIKRAYLLFPEQNIFGKVGPTILPNMAGSGLLVTWLQNWLIRIFNLPAQQKTVYETSSQNPKSCNTFVYIAIKMIHQDMR